MERIEASSVSASLLSPLHAAAAHLEGGNNVGLGSNGLKGVSTTFEATGVIAPPPAPSSSSASSAFDHDAEAEALLSSFKSTNNVSSSSSTQPSFVMPSTALGDALEAVRLLHAALDAESVPSYGAAFEEEAGPETITVGLLSRQELDRRREELENSRAREEAERASAHAQRLERVRKAEAAAHARVQQARKTLEKAAIFGDAEAGRAAAVREAGIYRTYQRAFDALRARIRSYEASVEARYGRLRDEEVVVGGDGGQGGVAGLNALLSRQMRVNWHKVPQPVEFRVSRLRAVKNKLPDGLYVLSVTLYNRLGGNPLRWSRLPLGHGASGSGPGSGGSTNNEDAPAATAPIRHRGRYYDIDLTFNQCVYGTAPSPSEVRPTNVWIFELFLLGGRLNPTDRVVAWGAVPACDGDMRVISGRFRVPLMRGEMNPDFDRFSSIEASINKDLDTWLSNLYVESVLLPRAATVFAPGRAPARNEGAIENGSGGATGTGTGLAPLGLRRRIVREWDVQVAYTSTLLRVRGEARVPKALPGKNAPPPPAAESVPRAGTAANSSSSAISSKKKGDGILYVGDYEDESLDATTTTGRGGGADSDEEEDNDDDNTSGSFYSQDSTPNDGGWGNGDKERAMRGKSSRLLLPGGVGGLAPSSSSPLSPSSSSPLSPSAVTSPGGTNAATPKTPKPKTVPSLPQSAFTYAVNKEEGRGLTGRRMRENARKLAFVRHELFADLQLRQFLTADFWLQLIQLLAALWLRIYIHYGGQYFFLRALSVPVYDFSPLVYSMTLKFVPDALPAQVDMAVILIGPLTVIVIFALFCFTSFASQRLLGSFPDPLSRFIAFFGLAAALDPLLIVIVDAIAGRYDCAARYPACADDIAGSACKCSNGDAWRLSQRFAREEGSGVPGGLLTALFYVLLCAVGLLGLYVYMLHLHLNGRMMDTYRRVYGTEDRFSVPSDMEVSQVELSAVVDRAHRWRGAKGSVRRVAVCDLDVRDPNAPGWKEVTTHLLVYTVAPDGKRELYRQFLRAPDGTLVEAFGVGGVAEAASPALAAAMARGKKVDAKDGQALQKDFFKAM